jgi:hypothetical protein
VPTLESLPPPLTRPIIEMRKLIAELKRLNVPIMEKTPCCIHEDGSIILGGAYDGVHFSVGNGYYYAVREREDGRLRFIKGKGNLAKELKQAMAL